MLIEKNKVEAPLKGSVIRMNDMLKYNRRNPALPGGRMTEQAGESG